MKLSKIYEPERYEEDIYALWEKSGSFGPKGQGNPYSVIMPPPNANASLHAGHSLTYVLQDIAVRYHRLIGDRTLYVPGADHAGFETQVVYEKQLEKTGKSRFDFTREELYAQIWDFVQNNKSGFEQQLRKLGISCDWEHFRFTLDKPVIDTTYSTFKKMWDDNLIYRGERLINYCTFHGTGFADIEVVHQEEQGALYYIRYPLTDGSDELVVATTRPETMLGDTGVAVHPEDDRYKKYVGKTIKLPITGREVPIISDPFVDKEFGTGAVKLTPAHDPTDYEIGEKHSLPKITVINFEGKMSDNTPERYRELTVKDARAKIVKELEEEGLLVKVEKLTHSVGHCYKCGTIIEPLLKDQWFVDMEPLAKRAILVLEKDQIVFLPANKRNQLILYLKNLKDWNISRQIAWGIPIPAFQNVDNPDDWIYRTDVQNEILTIDNKTYRRDPDVFDTWFSSGQWPFVTLGYPDSPDYSEFYPTSLMETGVDILYQWVARMICLGLYVTKEIPFKTVYLHGMVRSADGRKMSKSLGNVIALEDTIKDYGSDALRLGIIAGRSPGDSSAYAPTKILAGRNFCNKLWNIARYIENKLSDKQASTDIAQPESPADHWILSKLKEASDNISSYLDEYRFSEAYDQIYHFVWDDLADWYIEASKYQDNDQLLLQVFEQTLIILHSFAPFITEVLWQTLFPDKKTLLIYQDWPAIQAADKQSASTFEDIKSIVSETRFIVNSLNITDTKLHIFGQDFSGNTGLIEKLSHVPTVSGGEERHSGFKLSQSSQVAWLDISDTTLKAYQSTLKDREETQKNIITGLEKRLSNTDYVNKAPEAIIDQSKKQLDEAKEKLKTIEEEFRKFSEEN
jgi:valyl-tRNA synthetase